MASHDIPTGVVCKAQLAKLDERYSDARGRLMKARAARAQSPEKIDAILRELIALRRQMFDIESAEVERVYARYSGTESVLS